VLAAQMKNTATSDQNTGDDETSLNVPSAAFTIGAVFAGGAGRGSVPLSPNGRRPTSLGRSRISISTAKAETPSTQQTSASAVRQPSRSVSEASSGRKTSWPVATLAVMMPTTSPRRAADQPGADGAPRTRAGQAVAAAGT